MTASSGPVETGRTIENVFLNTLQCPSHQQRLTMFTHSDTQRHQHGLETRAEQYQYQPYLNASVLVMEAKTSVE